MALTPEEEKAFREEIEKKFGNLLDSQTFHSRGELDAFIQDVRDKIQRDENPFTGQHIPVPDKPFYIDSFNSFFGDPVKGEPEGKLPKYLRIISAKATSYGLGGADINDLFIRAREALNNAGLGGVDQTALSITIGILAGELIEKLAETKKFSEEVSPLMQQIWQEYKTYKAQRSATGSDSDDDFIAPGGIHERLSQPLPGGAQWTNPELRDLFRTAYDIDTVLDKGMTGADIIAELPLLKGRLLALKTKANLSATGVSQTEVIYNRLQEKHDSYVSKFLGRLDTATMDSIAATLVGSGEDAEFREFATSLNRLKKKLDSLQEQGVYLHNIDETDKVELQALYDAVKSKQKFLTDTDVPQVARESLLIPLYRQLSNNAEAILGFETDQLDTIFTDDVGYWLLGRYGQEWKEIERYWALVQAGNASLLTDHDQRRLEQFAERLGQAIGELQREPTKDVAYARRFMAIDILLNRISSILSQRTTEPTPVQTGQLEIMGKAPYNAQAWEAAFTESFANLPKERILEQLEWEMLELERREDAYSERARFAEHSEGVRFAGLKMWLDKMKAVDPDYGYYQQYFTHRLAIADMMGPFAASNRMTGDVVKSAGGDNFPQYNHWNHDFFIGTGTRTEEERFHHVELVRRIVVRIEEILDEQYDFILNSQSETAPGYFGFGRSAWMSGEGSFHRKLYQRLVNEFFNTAGVSEAELRGIIRIAYSGLALTGGRAELFMSYYATGSSPPQFAELGYEIECYPHAKEFNLATKEVTEIPEVVMGMHVDRTWLLKRATKIGLYKALLDFGLITRHRDKLWGIAGAPNISDVQAFKIFIDGMTEDQAEQILTIIREDPEPRDNSGYTRFRNLLRSIAISEAKCEAVHHYYDSSDRRKPKRKMQLLDLRGAADKHGDFLAPIVASARIMVYGPSELQEVDQVVLDKLQARLQAEGKTPEEISLAIAEAAEPLGYFGSSNAEFHDMLFPTHRAVLDFRKHVFSPPPELKGDAEHHHEDIAALAEDLFKTLSFTSPMKTLQDVVNWPKILELIDYRLHVIFAAYRAAGHKDPYMRPLLPLAQEAQHALGLTYSDKPRSLTDTLREIVETSGQTMSAKGEKTWMSIAEDRENVGTLSGKLYRDAKGDMVSMRQYLMELVDPRFGVFMLLTGQTRAERSLAGRLDNGLFMGGLESRGSLVKLAGPARHYIELLRRYNVSKPGLSEVFLPVGKEKAKAGQEKEQQEAEAAGKK